MNPGFLARRGLAKAAILAGAVLCLALPTSAQASTAKIDDSTLVVKGASDEINNFTLSQSGSTFTIEDTTVRLNAGSGCSQAGPNRVDCPAGSFDFIYVTAGDANDIVTNTTSRGGGLDGEEGNDQVNGGSGDDYVLGGTGTDVVNGGGGNDELLGQAGPDTMSGGDGFDHASYLWTSTGVTANLDGQSGDGAPGENDTIATDVEGIRGSSGADVLTGNGAANGLDAGSGNDTLDGGGGADLFDGDGGNDSIAARDGVVDDVQCDDGTDTVTADTDPDDTVAAGCETVDRAKYVGPPAPGGGEAPVPPQPEAPKVKISDNPVTVSSGGKAPVKVTCPGTAAGGCEGEVVIEFYEESGAAPKATLARRGGRRRVRVGRKRFRIAPGKSRKVPVKLNRRGGKTVRRRGRARARITVTTRDKAGDTTVSTRTITIKAERRGGRARRGGKRR
jgi:RTX calcium-binding nonapeptide repeat (4 copies)